MSMHPSSELAIQSIFHSPILRNSIFMAAYAALLSLTSIIHDIQHHHSPPISLPIQQLQSLTQIISSLQEYLEARKSPLADGDEADPLEMRIADAAYRAEDVIESQLVDIIQTNATLRQITSPAAKTSCFFNCFRPSKKPEDAEDEQTKSIKFDGDLQRVVEEMELIKQMMGKMDTEAVHADDISASAAPLRSFSSIAMVCPDAVPLGLMEKLIDGQPNCQIISIVGMGGIGKTTLARNIYDRHLIKKHFDVCAWVTISQKYNTREILCEVFAQVTGREKENLNEWKEDELGEELRKYLFNTRFLFVMDDMWSIDVWKKIQHSFPDRKKGSRILVTTRLSQLSSLLNTNYSLQMEFLDEDNSWELFSKTVFGDGSCPPELMEIGKKIVENCRGLPLSIVVVGGLLKKMGQTRKFWESVRYNLTSVVNLDNDKHCLRLLRMSYNHLPVYLKPCFLYLGMFEEDDEIKTSTIIKLWVSEGFLKPMKDRSLETTAKEFLKDLVDRNLILIDRSGSTGNIKSCKLHDLLRDLCLKEGEKEGFHHVVGRDTPQGIKRQCRRVVIRKNTHKKKALEDLKSIQRPRSVICENGKVPQCQNLGLLRTFHAYKFRTIDDKSYMNSVALQCVNLRHLAGEVRNLSSFFSSLHLFWNLQTLILSSPRYYKFTAPAEIWKMPHIRHIDFPENPVHLPDPPTDMDVILENLLTLKGVVNVKFSEEVVKKIPNIKKLKIYFYGQPNYSEELNFPEQLDVSGFLNIFEQLTGIYCVDNIKLLSKLESLHVSCDRESREAPYLHNFSFPHSLKSLTLEMNVEFEWEQMLEEIGSLPHLEKLRLWIGNFGSGKWEMVEGQFPELKYLGLFHVPGLKEWTIEGSSVLPRLQELNLFFIEELEAIPSEIGYISTLVKVNLTACSESVVRSAREIVDEQVECQGDQLPFHVDAGIWPRDKKEELQSLATHNFTVV